MKVKYKITLIYILRVKIVIAKIKTLKLVNKHSNLIRFQQQQQQDN